MGKNQDLISAAALSSMTEGLRNLAGHISPPEFASSRPTCSGRGETPAGSIQATDRLARIAAVSAQAPAARVCLSENGLIVNSQYGPYPDGALALDTRVVESNRGLMVCDAAGEFGEEPGFRSYAGTPIRAVDGSAATGSISVVDFQPRPDWSAGETGILEDLAGLFASALLPRADPSDFSSALIDSEDRFRKLYDSIPVGVYRAAADGRVLMANLAFARMLGFDSVDALLQEGRGARFRQESNGEFLERLQAQNGEIKGMESRWLRRDGVSVTMRENARLMRTPQGAICCVEGAVEDITETRRMDIALRATEARFQAFMDHLPGVAFIKDESGRRLYANRNWLDLFGNPFEEGREFASEDVFPPDVLERIQTHDREALEANRLMEFTERIPDSSGTVREWLTFKFPFPGETGQRLLGGIGIDMTERIRAEEELRESRERLSLAQAAAGISLWDLNVLTGELHWSPEEYRFLGIDPSLPPSAELWLSAIHPSDRETVRREIRGDTSQNTVSREYRVLQPDGSVRWMNSTGKTIRDSAGAAVRIIGVSRDITAQRNADDALRASEERFRTAAENASDVILEWELKPNKIRWYGRLQESLGVALESMPDTMEGVLALIHPEDRARTAAALARRLREPDSREVEFRLILPGGASVEVAHRGAVLRNPAGEPVKFIGVAVNITQRKREDAERARLAALVQSSSDAILSLSLEGVILSWNRGAEAVCGHAAAEVQGKQWCDLASPGRTAEFKRILAQVREGRSVNGHETTMHRADGRDVTVSLSLSPIHLPSGEIAGISAIARDITGRKKAEELLSHQARHDLLTGLPNRRLLHTQLKQALARASRYHKLAALLYIDLDGFKQVNDSFGHGAGDELLQKVAQRLQSRARAGDTLARTGGDEFMLVAEGIESSAGAATLAQSLLTGLSQPFPLSGRETFVTASIGIGLYPEDAHDAETLERSADTAMYEAKREGKNRIRFYTQAMGHALRERVELGNDLRNALELKELSIEYQPQFRLNSGRLTGMEALMRWRRGHLGWVKPRKFIPVAEETGLIVPLGEWAIEQACRQLRVWERNDVGSIQATVNVSAAQLLAGDFAGKVREILDRTGVGPQRIEIELNESVFGRDFPEIARTMRMLHDLGVGILLDDFGAGNSSFNYLRQLPIDGVKIDRTFIAALGKTGNGSELIQAIVSLAHSLDLRVVAEGIETAAQLAALRETGCDEGQGFLLGRPAPPEHWHGPALRRETIHGLTAT